MPMISPILLNPSAQLLMFWCPACDHAHTINAGPGGWKWNGDPNAPTFEPSIKETGVKPMTDEEHAAWMATRVLPQAVPHCCHSFVTKGVIQFLSDCTHSMAGQNAPMIPWPTDRAPVPEAQLTPEG